MKKLFFFFAVMLLMGVSALKCEAQKSYEKDWIAVEKAVGELHFSTADKLSEKIYSKALKEHNSRELFNATVYLCNIRAQYQQDAEDSSMALIRRTMPLLDDEHQALLHLICFDYLTSELRDDRWMYNENQESNEEDLPRSLWSTHRILDSIKSHFAMAMSQKEFLKQAKVEDYKLILEEGKGCASENLFDVAIELAKGCCCNYIDAHLKKYDKGLIVSLFGSMDDFAKADLSGLKEMYSDEVCDFYSTTTLRLMQEQARMNLDASAERRLWIDLERIKFLLASDVDNSLVLEGVKNCFAYHTKDETAIHHEAAGLCREIALIYMRANDTVSAAEWCQRGIDLATSHSQGCSDKGEGYSDCYNLLSEIQTPKIDWNTDVDMPVLPNQPSLRVMRSVNVDTLYFAIAEFSNNFINSDWEDIDVGKLKVLKKWGQPTNYKGDYKEVETFVYVPAVERGCYLLVVGVDKDFKKTPLKAERMIVTAYGCVNTVLEDNMSADAGMLVDLKSGKAVAGKEVVRKCYEGEELLFTESCITDQDGFYQFPKWEEGGWNSWRKLFVEDELLAEVGGYYYGSRYSRSRNNVVDVWTFQNKPVYRLGEEVEFGIVVSTPFYGGVEGHVVRGEPVFVDIMDPNYKVVYSDTLTTDEFGRCHSSYKLPATGLNGHYTIRSVVGKGTGYAASGRRRINVEAYKQPKFMVSLPSDNEDHQFGKEVAVSGMAVSYSGMPLNGAKVGYSVSRRTRLPWWRNYYWRHPISQDDKMVVEGETFAKEDGSFEIKFMPLPDSTQSDECYYEFTVAIDVTDINGESHSAYRKIRIGNDNRVLQIRNSDGQRFDEVKFDYTNLDLKPIKGQLQVKVERLRMPEQRLFLVNSKAYHSMDSATFRCQYPNYAYNKEYGDMDLWEVEGVIYEGAYEADGTNTCHIAIGNQPSGNYRILVKDGSKEYKHYITVTTPKEKKCQSMGLLYVDVAQSNVEVGSTAEIRIGSRFEAVCVHYIIQVGDFVKIKQGTLMLNDEVKTLKVPVTKKMLGGFKVTLMAVKEGNVERIETKFDVPYSHKMLDIEYETFRDKVQPGSQEQWTLRIMRKGRPAEAAMMATLYDEALSQFGTLEWYLNGWLNNSSYVDLLSLAKLSEVSGGWMCITEPKYLHWMIHPYTLKGMNSSRFIVAEKAYPLMAELGMVEVESGANNTDEEEEIVLISSDSEVESVVASVAGMGYDDGATARRKKGTVAKSAIAVLAEEEVVDINEDAPAFLRTNLNTSAFFMPTLKSDSKSGRVEIRFTMPETMTQWHLHTQAWTKDMAVGSSKRMIVTQKQLMVTPNVPRFLRHGDKVVLVAKVGNMGEKDQEVAVELVMTNAQDSSRFYSSKKKVSVAKGQNGSVEFEFEVPSNVFVAQYRIIARGEGCSDGEQALIPVLANRQLVTESMSMYINGKGEKQYSFENLKSHTSSTLQHYGLQLEWTTNPMWYAIQSMPHLKELESPSNVYLASQLLINQLSLDLLNKNPEIEEMLKVWSTEEPDAFLSQLEKNEEIKQTLISETPWLREAKNESEQHRQLGSFFEREKIQAELNEAECRLLDGQMAVGAWSWMPQGHYESVYTTEVILQKMGELKHRGIALSKKMEEALSRALNYIDTEEQKYYEEYIKGRSAMRSTDIFYLYMRSFWSEQQPADIVRQAYDYYYRNAMSERKSYSNLYTRAQLALIFYRHGDKEAAREIAVALKEAALYSDEMGMFWRDNLGGCWWYERPIETQALLIDVMDEVLDDQESVALMQQWLLKQKQTTHWGNDQATSHAITALMKGSGKLADGSQLGEMEIIVGGRKIESDVQKGTGYITKKWDAGEITEKMSDVSLKKQSDGIAWGAMFWQYFEDLDKIPYSEMGIKLDKRLYRIESDGNLTPITEAKVGDKIRVRIMIACDRDLEFLELKDQRAGGMEPMSTRSGWRWNDGLSYYTDIHDASSSFFIDRLTRGRYVLEYDLWANNAGDFSSGVATMQCMYAPEFRCNTSGTRIKIK